MSNSMAVALFIALLVSLLMMADALQNSARFERLYSGLLLINIFALLALLTLISLNLRTLIRQVKKGRVGARLTVRLLSLLVILSTVPVIIVYYFSLGFLHQRLDSWFDVDIELALTKALDLSRAALDARMRDALKQAQTIAEALGETEDNQITIKLDELRHRSGAYELTLLAANGHIIASNSADIGRLLPSQLQEKLLQLKQASSYIGLESLGDERQLYIRVAIRLIQDHRERRLYALFPLTERVSELANSVEKAFIDYKERRYLHKPLKLSFTLVLSLILLLSIFSTVWVAFFAARRFVAPLNNLIAGTKAVASGDYEKQLPVHRLDELGFLVHSFNEMTRNIAQTRDEVKQSQQVADSQRIYLEIVLKRLSSGVISLDHEQRLRTANPAADHILGVSISTVLGATLTQLQQDYPNLHTLCTAINTYVFTHVQDWREEITLLGPSGRKILTCRGTQLNASSIPGGGYVIVFDDVTTLIQAQREAAWSEVARRLAHEIKNPLTPIQLSAERLRQKYLATLSEKEANVLDRMTHTIIQQVKAMKEMVNAFSDYAKHTTMQWKKVDLNQILIEVVDLYQHGQATIYLALDEDLPLIEADRGRLRQSLHNLIKNGLEANPTETRLMIATYLVPDLHCVELSIQDQGPGVPKHLLDQIFEPYVTTKSKGTGLGLAIVKKIVEEHGGTVWIENTPGACVHMRLPIRTQIHALDTALSI